MHGDEAFALVIVGIACLLVGAHLGAQRAIAAQASRSQMDAQQSGQLPGDPSLSWFAQWGGWTP